MAIISFTSLMDLSGSTKVFQFTDTSNYIGQGIALADVIGNLTITSPSGAIVHTNSNFLSPVLCDIDRVTSANNQTLIQVPVGLDGEPQAGIYTIEYKVFITGDAFYTVTNTYNVNYTSPVVAIAQTVDCISPLFTSVDVTNYTVNGTAPVIDRVHTINFPFGSAGEGSPVIGVTQTLTTSTFYNGTQTTEIFSELTYTFPDGMMIYDEVSGSKEILVDCTDVCAIYCCIRALEQRMISYSTTNTILYRETTLLFSQIMGLVGLVTLAQRCGKSDEINGYLSSIKLLANCTDDCACSGDAPVQVAGLSGLVNQVIVQSGGDPIEVEGLTSGGVTTYTIYFSGALLTTINSLYNTEVVAGVNLLSITDATFGIVKTFTVNGLKATVSNGPGIIVTPTVISPGHTDYDVAVNFDQVLTWSDLSYAGLNFAATLMVPYLECLGASATMTNNKVAQFIYPGTNNVAPILKLKANLWNEDGITASGVIVQVYDITNSTIIATSASNATPTNSANIIDLGAISNLPASQAVFQIQVRTVATEGEKPDPAKLASLLIGTY
jgi:hypothetical protein